MTEMSVRLIRAARAGILIALVIILIVGCSGKGDPIDPGVRNSVQGANSAASTLERGPVKGSVATGLSDLAGKPKYLSDEVLVVMKDRSQTADASFVQGRPLRLAREIKCRWGTVYELKITDGTPVMQMVDRLKLDPRVRIAEPNFIYYFCEEPYFPNDPMWAYTDDPTNPRDSAYDQWGPAMVGASIVWNQTKGTSDAVIAIMDTGVRFDHEDLNANLWINEDEIPDNDVDDDLNGYIDDWWGWDTWDMDNDPYDDGAYASYHGSACSGVAAAVQDNEKGLSGVAPGVKIMAVKVDLTGSGGFVSTVVEGMNYAAVNRADIVSMSFRSYEYSEIMKIACDDAWDNGHGVILMGAIGNESTTELCYPNAYDSVMAIGGTCPFTEYLEPRDEKRIVAGEDDYYWGSNYGSHLTVMGYGAQYTTTYGGANDTYWDGGYNGFFGGTSCATPFSAGVMALIRSHFLNKSPAWSVQRIEETADDLDVPGFDIETGYGRVNPLRALYGSDRYSDQEDPEGFVPLALPDAQMFDTIHDVPGNPYRDTEDLYKFVMDTDGYMAIDLDIFTWGEDLDIALYSDREMTQLVNDSTGPNHFDSSFESIGAADLEIGHEYYIRVFSPAEGSSTTYGLSVRSFTNDLIVTGESIAPAFSYQTGNVVPFLKLNLEVGYKATLDEIIVSKSGTVPNANLALVSLYRDSNDDGVFDDGDELVGQETPPGTNRARIDDLDLSWDHDKALVLFVAAALNLSEEGSRIALSLESYKDVSTKEGLVAPYAGFPIASDFVELGVDDDPPYWVSTVGAQIADPAYSSANIGFNTADDLLTPPVKYNIYYTDTLPFDIATANKKADVAVSGGTTTDLKAKVGGLTDDVEWHFVVRAEDQAGNEEDNLVIVSCTPSGSGDPTDPQILGSIQFSYPTDLALNGSLLLVADLYNGLQVFDRTDPVNPDLEGVWTGDYPYSVTCDDSYAYVGGYFDFYVIDLSDPSWPQTTDSAYVYGAQSSDKSGDWVYCVASSPSLVPVDVADPYDVIDYPEVELPYFGVPFDIQISGDYIYLAFVYAGIVAIDRTTPSAPVIENTFGSSMVAGLCVSGSTLYATDLDIGTLSLYDIGTDPANPPLLGQSTEGPGYESYDVVALGDYAYVARYDYGLVVFDVSTPSDPEVVGQLPMAGAGRLVTDGALIYVLAENTLYIVI